MYNYDIKFYILTKNVEIIIYKVTIMTWGNYNIRHKYDITNMIWMARMSSHECQVNHYKMESFNYEKSHNYDKVDIIEKAAIMRYEVKIMG